MNKSIVCAAMFSFMTLVIIVIGINAFTDADSQEDYQIYSASQTDQEISLLYDGGTYDINAYGRSYTSIKTFAELTSDTKWDTDKPLVLSGKEYLCWPGEGDETKYQSNMMSSGWKIKALESITVKLKIGDVTTDPIGVELDTLTTCELSGVTLNVIISPNDTGVAPNNGDKTAILQINPDPNKNLVEFLKVTDQTQFASIDSPIEVIFTMTPDETWGPEYNEERSVKIVVEPDKSNTSTGAIDYESKVQNGYSILDIRCDDTYSGSDNYILIIAKYADSIVYNSYLPVPSTTTDCQRIALSNLGLTEVIIELVPANDAFGDSVPGYLGYTYYVPQ